VADLDFGAVLERDGDLLVEAGLVRGDESAVPSAAPLSMTPSSASSVGKCSSRSPIGMRAWGFVAREAGFDGAEVELDFLGELGIVLAEEPFAPRGILWSVRCGRRRGR